MKVLVIQQRYGIGDMVIFTSNTYHGVEPVTEGTRYALIIWALSYNEI